MAEARKPVLLICDDEPDMRAVLAVAARARYEVLEASDGPAAVELVARRKPDYMLLDLSMPGWDGLETLRRVKALHPAMTVVMLTAVTDIEKAKAALNLGARAYVTKPVSFRGEELRVLLEGSSAAEGSAKPWRVEGA